jgi:hypothetical protein
MDPAQQAMISALRSIRDQADSVLKNIEQPYEQRSMRWKCKECRYVKRFTKPVLSETAGRCPDAKLRRLILFPKTAGSESLTSTSVITKEALQALVRA